MTLVLQRIILLMVIQLSKLTRRVNPKKILSQNSPIQIVQNWKSKRVATKKFKQPNQALLSKKIQYRPRTTQSMTIKTPKRSRLTTTMHIVIV